MIESIVKSQYGFNVLHHKKLLVGAGSNAYIVETDNGKYLLKNPSKSEINNPELEQQLCEFLISKGIPVSEFVKNLDGEYMCAVGEEIYHMQKFVEGVCYDLNTAPDWLMRDSARFLGMIHTALDEYEPLPMGIGADFFKFMTPQSALASYQKTLQLAERNGDLAIAEDLLFRIELMDRFPVGAIDIHDFTCKNTHGDFFISQIICGEGKINAVIDWTTACIHPVAWEIFRSFVYGEPTCIDGEINIPKLISYIEEYRRYAQLTVYDITMMPKLFYYQIAVCDYYNQYYQSTAGNRNIYLHQARFSTKLLKWFDFNMEELINQLNFSLLA